MNKLKKMEASLIKLPFQKLRYDKYLILEIMMYVDDYKEAWKFMFILNKASRTFLETNASTIYNGFINDGLYYYELNCNFINYQHFDKFYSRILKRNTCNRIVTIKVFIES